MYLENSKLPGFLGQEKEEETMGDFRSFVNIGTREKPVMKRLAAKSQQELNDRIVKAYVDSGRIWEFLELKSDSENKPRETFGQYVERWISLYKVNKIRGNTLKDYKTILTGYLIPEFGNREFASITTDDFQKFLNKNKHLSMKYLTNIKILFGSIAKDAVEDGVIDKDPTASRKLFIPSTKKKERKPLKKEEYLEILEEVKKLKGRLYLLIVLLMLSGLRRGEVLGLKWEDFCWDEGYFVVQRNVTFSKGISEVGETKTESGKRKVPILKELRTFLEPYKKESGFIIEAKGRDQQPICKSTFDRDWYQLNKLINLHGATPHIFRHTFLTLLAASGVDIKTLQTIAGHSNAEVTMRVYVHPVDSNIVKAGAMFSKSVFDNVDWTKYKEIAEKSEIEEEVDNVS